MKFKEGDRVVVTFGHGWNGPGVIIRISSGIYIIDTDSLKSGGFNEGQFYLDITYNSPLSQALR